MSANASSTPGHSSEGGGSVQGDAAAAVAAIEAWLGERVRSPVPDWEGVLAAVEEGLRRILAAPAVRNDAVICAIAADMPHARDMDELFADIDRLHDRALHVLAHPDDVQPIRPPATAARKAAGRVKLRL